MRSTEMTSIYAGSGHLKIGLLGGSFNPAHAGHRQISLAALKRLRLDQVWWLVTPQNPLKSSFHTPAAGLRLRQALKVADHPKIKITKIEEKLGLHYSADTLKALLQRFRNYHFIWLMGADNLIQISSWHHWRDIFRQVPVAVFSRPGYSLRALSSQAAQTFKKNRINPWQSKGWEKYPLPGWFFFHDCHNFLSSTLIRSGQAKDQVTRTEHLVI
ncbi:MAG TPA: nicotinate-nucleotide adenylyltransferase [Alphaproteobacteria bacterium]|nr:nicotinate-nucleotide adenylyltransferase [Alphaproteobacteria bacterium]